MFYCMASTIPCSAKNKNVSRANEMRAIAKSVPHRHRLKLKSDASIVTGESSKTVLTDIPKSYNHENKVLLGHKCRADFDAKYMQFDQLAKGGYGTIYAGFRRSDSLPVAIKIIPSLEVPRQSVTLNGRKCRIPVEVLLMHKAAGRPESVGKSAAVTLLDWYSVRGSVILVMERPLPSKDLRQYLEENGPMPENHAKSIMKQMVDAAIDMRSKGIFHRDIKAENILMENSKGDLRARIIDFGSGCNYKAGFYNKSVGTQVYSPPEIFRTCRYKADPTTVWQLAALLFQMTDEATSFDTDKFLKNDIKIGLTRSKGCRELLSKCLALEPNERATLEEVKHHHWLN